MKKYPSEQGKHDGGRVTPPPEEVNVTEASMQPQPFCALPWCGKAPGGAMKQGPDGEYPEYIDFHHAYGREHSDLGVYICHDCHMAHHDGTRRLNLAWSGGWIVEGLDGGWYSLVVYDPDDVTGGFGSRIRAIMDSTRHSDWEVARMLAAIRAPRSDIEEWCVDELGISHKGVGGWLTKRLTYYTVLKDYTKEWAVEDYGVTNGYRLAKLIQDGAPALEVLSDFGTMPRAQFDEQYAKADRKRRKPRCHDCGAEMRCDCGAQEAADQV